MENKDLTDDEYYDVLCQNSKRVTEEINLLPISDRIKQNIDDFLDYHGIAGKKVRPYKSYFINGKAGIWFDLDDNGYCYILFGEDDTWEWKVEAYVRGKDEIAYKKELSYSGSRDLLFENKDGTTTACFIFHDEAMKLITIPDEFTVIGQPRFKFKDLYIIWETGRYDGILSGYAIFRNEIVHINCVDETFFERQRLFAIYRLSIFEKIIVGIRRWRWGILMTSPLMWKCYMTKHRIKNHLGLNQTVEQSKKAGDDFHNSHKILGYAEW